MIPIAQRGQQLQRLMAQLTAVEPRRAKVPETLPKLKAVQQRHELMLAQSLQAYDPDTTVAWRTFLVPTELLYATGAMPFTPESACAMLARSQSGITKVIARAEQQGYVDRTCSFLKATVGGLHEGLLPTPNLVVGSDCFCSGIGSVLHDLATETGAPFFHLNLPLHAEDAGAVDYVARQLRELTTLLCQLTGISETEVEHERLPAAIDRAHQAAGYWQQVLRLRQATPSPMSGREALDFATVLAQTWGTQEIIDVYRGLRDELQTRLDDGVSAVPEEAARLFWLHLRPYYPNALMRNIEQAGGCVVLEEMNFPARLDLNPDQPYRSLAREVLRNGGRYRAFDRAWQDDIRQVVRDFKIDAAVRFAHDHCTWADAVSPPMHRFLKEELGLPVLSLTGDCLVQGRDRLQNTRALAFLEGLESKRRGLSLGAKEPTVASAAVATDGGRYFAGIDLGSATIKVVVVDEEGSVCGQAVERTGIQSHQKVEQVYDRALSKAGGLNQADVSRVVATGVGREEIPFASQAVTELRCHARGVLQWLPEARTIIDIGGQDTKVILVREALLRMNGACAAGTGKFLETIARALDLDFGEMVKLDQAADRAATINKTCTVFAESEVVNLVAGGSDLAATIRGVHEMVASKAAALLRQISPEIIPPVVMSGGVAQNGGVVRALADNLGEEVRRPEQPQLIGALGAALIAMEGG